MKQHLAATVCAFSFALGSTAYAQGTKGPSGSGAENPDKQSHMVKPGEQNTVRDSNVRKEGTPDKETPRPGGQDSTTSVAPAEPSTPRNTEPGAGRNRSSSGDSSGPRPRSRDTEGFR